MKKDRSKILNFIKNKKIIAIFLIAIFTILLLVIVPSFSQNNSSTIWDGTIADSFEDGTGAYNDPYIISNGGEFAYFLSLLNGDNNLEYFNKYYELVNNINFNNLVLPSSSADKKFSGNLNGNGFTLSNITITSGYTVEDKTSYNLFSSIENATIKYLNIESVNFNVSNGYASLFGSSYNSIISNISVKNFKVNGEGISSVFYIDDLGSNELFNINLSSISGNNMRQLIYNYQDASVSNIIYNTNSIELINGNVDSAYYYTVSDGNITFEDISVNDILNSLNNNNDLEWYIVNNEFKIKNLSMLNNISSYNMDADITEHDSGIEGTTLYINDLERDYNYYKSLNYTEIIDGNSLPGEVSTKYYDDEYLIKAQIEYSGVDINDSNLVGRVSPTENVNKYVYFKYYPLVRDSSGNLLKDRNGNNYIKIELPDNIFSARPSGKGFNGWVTTTNGVLIEYDSEIYTRYAIVPITDEKTIRLTFNASWTDANIQTGNNNNISALDDAGMKPYTKTVTYQEMETVTSQCNPYFNQQVQVLSVTPTRVRNGQTIPQGSYYYIGSSNSSATTTTNLTYASSNVTCNTSNRNRCIYYSYHLLNDGDSYNESDTYNVVYRSGNYYRYTNDMTNYVSYNTCTSNQWVTKTKEVSKFNDGNYTIGYYYYVGTNIGTQSGLYYDSLGRDCSVSNSTCSNGAYKLIQYNDSLNTSNGNSISIAHGTDGEIDSGNNYYYLVTRDTNILVNTISNSSLSAYMSSKPYTLTSSYDGSAISNTYITTNSAQLNADMVIENIKIYGVGGTSASTDTHQDNSLGANSHNLKVGRNVFYSNQSGTVSSTNKIFNGIYGLGNNYSGSAVSPDRFKVIVESGVYNYLLSGTAATCDSNSWYCNETVNTYYVRSDYVYGSDYDRVLGDNSKLIVYFNALSTIKDNFNSSSNNKKLPSSYMTIKSGRYGKTSSNEYSTDNAYGAYAGGRTNTHYANALRVLKIEGGDINVVNGGPCVENDLSSNSVAIYMTGGTVREIYGGAGTTTTYGNRLVSVTGGNVLYSVFGGSDAYNSGSEGLLTGSTLVYIGGTAIIGDDDLINRNSTLFNVTSGNVFGAGNGETNGTTAGIVNNSHIIINGGLIKNSVYAGGNHGSVGTKTSASGNSIAKIDIYDGKVNNSVFGAGESFGGGTKINDSATITAYLKDDYYTDYYEVETVYTTQTVTVTRDNTGEITSGPTTTNSTTEGRVPANVYLPDGSINASQLVCSVDVVGATQGEPVTNTTTSRRNHGSWWYQDYYTTTTETTTTTVTCYYSGRIAKTGEKYNTNSGYYIISDNKFVKVTPSLEMVGDVTNSYNHSVLVNVYGGEVVGAIYGGSNTSGILYGNVNINLYSGLINGVYGGGKGVSGISESVSVLGNTYINSLTTDNNSLLINALYGGSSLGLVNTNGSTKIIIDGGTFTNIYGGGEGNNSTAPISNGNINVTINNGIITNVYGGNNLAGIPSGNVYVYLKGGTIANAFGGGSSSSVNISNIYLQDSVNVGYMYGGSNTSGTVSTSNVYVENGMANYVYGGNNSGGKTIKSNVIATGGTVIDIYGGGREAITDDTDVKIDGVIATNAYGGGEKASITNKTNINMVSGTVNNIYGGSNVSGEVPSTNITATGGKTDYIYGGGKLASIGKSNIEIDGVTSSYVFGGGERASVNDNTNILVLSGNITNVFGGSNYDGVVDNAVITATGGVIDTVYGGNNAGGTTKNTLINENGASITTIYGGGDSASSDSSVIKINSCTGTIDAIYGGGKSASVDTTDITISGGTITNIYGGSNISGDVQNTKLVINNGDITNLYGGGNNAVISNNTDILVNDGTIYDLFGGGNNASVKGNTKITALGGVIHNNLYGGGNEGTVLGDTSVLINNVSVEGSAYAGGNGTSATVFGNTNISLGGNTIVGTDTCETLSACSVFGGGKAAYTGDVTTNNSNAIVNIVGATIYGNVYGGANTSRVYGQTKVNIGGDVTLTDNLNKSAINISGSIFGGGEANASGSSVYDYSYISVTVAIDVNINGKGYDNFIINGSIFGSGNASSTSGVSNIKISNYGTLTDPKHNISIQRTDLLVLDNSAIVLSGATDRTNEYSSVLFTLSRIDELDLTNNSTLFLEKNANLLKSFKSLVSTNSSELARVEIKNDTFKRNVNNRLYMYEGEVLNISTAENVNASGAYGTVAGMTFYGMYKYTNDGSVYTGIYGDYDYKSQLSWGGVFNNSSYVLAQHMLNHDITVDGFYTNNIDEDTSLNMIDYIDPTPKDSPFYMWLIGGEITNISVDLEASRYSTLGAKEVSFINFSAPNTSFSIIDFDYSGLAKGVSLVNKNSLPRVAESTDIADNVMSLYVESGPVGWLTDGSTSFMSSNPNVVGTTTYVGDNTSDAPSLMFYLHHSKNLGSTGNMGTVKIVITSVTKIDDLTSETKILVVSVNLSRKLIPDDNYEASITSGRRYELFGSTVTNVTTKSSISAYYSLYTEKNIYKTGYRRTLVSNTVLPLNTKITMIDLSQDNPNYYYHVINNDDVNDALEQLNTEGDIHYDLSMFELMGSLSSSVYYDDSQMNSLNYHEEDNYSSEEFIFILDFENTDITSDILGSTLLIEMLNSNDDTILGVLGIQREQMTYNLYNTEKAMIDIDASISNNKIYSGNNATIDLKTEYTQANINGVTISDTLYADYKLGIKINLINSNGDIVSGTSLIGLYYEINGIKYAPNIDGTTRIKVSDKVGNLQSWIKLVTGNSNIATGNYTIRIEAFGSSDGIYYGLSTSAVKEIPIYIINEIYGLDINTTAESMVIDSKTGLSLDKTNIVTYSIKYNSGLESPNIHMRLYRRRYDEIYSTDYELVDLGDYVNNTLFGTNKDKEYLMVNNPNEESELKLMFKDNLLNGTYRLEFILYDDNTEIGSIDKYIIIK